MPSQRFEDLNERMLKRHFVVNPHLATQFGVHDPYDYTMPDGSRKRLTDTMQILDEWYEEALTIRKEDDFSFDQRLSLGVLGVARDAHRFAIDDYPIWRMFPDALEIPGYVFLVMLSREYWPFEKRMEALTSRIEQLPRYLKEFRTRFDEDARPVKLWTESAIVSCRGFPGFLEFLSKHPEGKIPEEEMLRLEKAAREAAEENSNHLKWLEELAEVATDDFHIGKEKLTKLLKIRGLPYSPEEVLRIAEKYLGEMRAEKLRIARGMSKEGTLEAAYRTIYADTRKDFDEVMTETDQIVNSAQNFLRDRDLVTIPPGAILKIIETPDFMAGMVTTAATDLPAPFEEVPTGFYLQTRPKTDEELKGVWNHAMIVNTAVHEAYPGHFLQGVLSSPRPWMHQLLEMQMTSDTIVTAYETQEGWAHYCEWMMYDQGFEHNDPAAVIMLDGGIWRAVRVIYDVKLAYGESTVKEMAELLAKEAGTPISAAESDVTNFTRTPGYPLSYLIGRHMVFELKRELENKLGTRFELKKFHDLLASNGNLPFFLAKEAVKVGMGIESELN